MTETEISELLSELIALAVPVWGGGLTKKVAGKLVTDRVEEQIGVAAGNAYEVAKAVLAEYGTVFKDQPELGLLGGIVLAGAANMNPAFLLIRAEEGTLSVIAMAKEGLIKQHTAEKAIGILKAGIASYPGCGESHIKKDE